MFDSTFEWIAAWVLYVCIDATLPVKRILALSAILQRCDSSAVAKVVPPTLWVYTMRVIRTTPMVSHLYTYSKVRYRDGNKLYIY